MVCGLYYYFYNELAFMVLDMLNPVGQVPPSFTTLPYHGRFFVATPPRPVPLASPIRGVPDQSSLAVGDCPEPAHLGGWLIDRSSPLERQRGQMPSSVEMSALSSGGWIITLLLTLSQSESCATIGRYSPCSN